MNKKWASASPLSRYTKHVRGWLSPLFLLWFFKLGCVPFIALWQKRVHGCTWHVSVRESVMYRAPIRGIVDCKPKWLCGSVNPAGAAHLDCTSLHVAAICIPCTHVHVSLPIASAHSGISVCAIAIAADIYKALAVYEKCMGEIATYSEYPAKSTPPSPSVAAKTDIRAT